MASSAENSNSFTGPTSPWSSVILTLWRSISGRVWIVRFGDGASAFCWLAQRWLARPIINLPFHCPLGFSFFFLFCFFCFNIDFLNLYFLIFLLFFHFYFCWNFFPDYVVPVRISQILFLFLFVNFNSFNGFFLSVLYFFSWTLSHLSMRSINVYR